MATLNIQNSVKKDLVIFIPVHKNYVYLDHMLRSIRSERYNIKFYIVNNGSDEATNKFCFDLRNKEGFTVEHYDEALGVSRVWNLCLDIAIKNNYEYVVISNADLLYSKSCVDLMGAYLDSNPNELITFPVDLKNVYQIVEKYPFLTETTMNRFTYDKSTVESLQNLVDGVSFGGSEPVPVSELVNYACFMVRPKRLVEDVGYFDENFLPAYWEDTDMHWRIASHGLKSKSILNATMLHINSRSLIEGGFQNTSYIPNAFYFSRKHDANFSQDQLIRDTAGNVLLIKTFPVHRAYESRPPVRIFDCFIFDGDLDILELRLNCLASVIDKFVIIEPSFERDGSSRQVLLRKYKELFPQFSSKIKIVIAHTDANTEKTQPDYVKFLLKSLVSGLPQGSLNDVVIISDINQIPDPRKVAEFARMRNAKVFLMQSLVNKVNQLEVGTVVEGPRSCNIRDFKHQYNNDLDLLKRSVGFYIKDGGISITKKESMLHTESIEINHKSIAYLRNLPENSIWI